MLVQNRLALAARTQLKGVGDAEAGFVQLITLRARVTETAAQEVE